MEAEQQYEEQPQQEEGEAGEEMEVAVTYQTLDTLQEHGIAPNDIQKLNDAGFHTVESVR